MNRFWVGDESNLEQSKLAASAADRRLWLHTPPRAAWRTAAWSVGCLKLLVFAQTAPSKHSGQKHRGDDPWLPFLFTNCWISGECSVTCCFRDLPLFHTNFDWNWYKLKNLKNTKYKRVEEGNIRTAHSENTHAQRAARSWKSYQSVRSFSSQNLNEFYLYFSPAFEATAVEWCSAASQWSAGNLYAHRQALALIVLQISLSAAYVRRTMR